MPSTNEISVAGSWNERVSHSPPKSLTAIRTWPILHEMADRWVWVMFSNHQDKGSVTEHEVARPHLILTCDPFPDFPHFISCSAFLQWQYYTTDGDMRRNYRPQLRPPSTWRATWNRQRTPEMLSRLPQRECQKGWRVEACVASSLISFLCFFFFRLETKLDSGECWLPRGHVMALLRWAKQVPNGHCVWPQR